MNILFATWIFITFGRCNIMSNINNGIDHKSTKPTSSLGGSVDPEEQANQPDPLFESKLERLISALGAKNPTELMKILNLTLGSFGSARKRQRLPAQWIVEAFEKHGISSDWLLSGEGPMRRGEELSEQQAPYNCLSPEDFELLPLLESRVAAGPEGEIIFDEVADQYPFKKWWIERMVGKDEFRKKFLVLIKVRGDSMSPTINPGEVVMVDTYEGERLDVRTGSIYMIIMPDGSSAIKRLALSRKEDGRMTLICMSDNVAVYRPFEFDLVPGRSLKQYILGRVRWAGKEFD